MGRLPNTGLRDKILQEAIGIIYREGPRRITMRFLAKQLGYSAATIYLYFQNKQELLKEIALYGYGKLAVAMQHVERIEDTCEALAEMARVYIEFGLTNPQLYSLMFQELDMMHDLTPDEGKLVQYSCCLARNRYSSGIESGVFRPGDPDVEAMLGWAWAHGFVQLVLSERLPPALAQPKQLRAIRELAIEERFRGLRA